MNVDDYGPLLTAEAFLEIDFGERIKAELDGGEIHLLERGPAKRVAVAGNLLVSILPHFRGSGRRTYGPQLALRTGDRSVRFPDVAVYDSGGIVARYGNRDLMSDPVLAVHVGRTDRVHGRLADEYRLIASLQGLLLVDYEREYVRSSARLASGDWRETIIGPGGSADLQTLGLSIPHADIFAFD